MLQTDESDLRLSTMRRWKIVVGIAVLVICVSVVCAFALVKHVTIDDGYGQTLTVTTMKNNVGDLIAEQQITLNQGDRITPNLGEKIGRTQHVSILRAVAVTLKADGNERVIYSVSQTVEQLLEEAGICLGELDVCNLPLEDKIAADMVVEVTRISEEVITVDEEIPCTRVVQKNFEMPKGQDRVVQAGKNGVVKRQYRITIQNGQEVERKLEGETVVTPAINHIVEVGALEVVITSRGELRYKAKYIMNASGYDISYESTGKRQSDPGYGITATGMRATKGVVAVDPRVIPLGSRLYIESADGSWVYGNAVAGDTGGAIKGNKIDLCFSSRSEALQFGRRTVVVYVLE